MAMNFISVCQFISHPQGFILPDASGAVLL